MKHVIKIVAGVAVIAAVCYGLNVLRSEKKQVAPVEIVRPVRTVTLRGDGESFTRKYFGVVQGGKRADLSFRVSGTLNKINAEKGQSVKRGALLASLDPRDFNTAISQAQSAVSQAQAQYNNAETDFKRYENLYQKRVIAKAQYDTSKTQLEVARSAVNAAKAKLKAARDALKDTELRAPFDGIIADRMAENFQDIVAKQAIFSLQDLDTLEIVFSIPDNDVLVAPIGKVKNLHDLKSHAENFRMNARFEALPERVFPLTVKEIATQASLTNTYPVTATMPRHDELRILPGMAVNVEVDFSGGAAKSEGSNKFSVPSTAILSEGKNNYVWRFNVGHVSRVPVKVGAIHNDSTVEIDGETLSGGDVIVTAGVYFLHEGQRVRLLEDLQQ